MYYDSPDPSPAPLSPWIETHSRDGRMFYYNEITRESVWELPSTVRKVPLLARDQRPMPKRQRTNVPRPPSQSIPASSLTSPWRKVPTADGDAYFYHVETRETRWDPPPGYGGAGSALPTHPLPSTVSGHVVRLPSEPYFGRAQSTGSASLLQRSPISQHNKHAEYRARNTPSKQRRFPPNYYDRMDKAERFKRKHEHLLPKPKASSSNGPAQEEKKKTKKAKYSSENYKGSKKVQKMKIGPSSYICTLCDVRTNAAKNMEGHINGKTHKKQVLLLAAQLNEQGFTLVNGALKSAADEDKKKNRKRKRKKSKSDSSEDKQGQDEKKNTNETKSDEKSRDAKVETKPSALDMNLNEAEANAPGDSIPQEIVEAKADVKQDDLNAGDLIGKKATNGISEEDPNEMPSTSAEGEPEPQSGTQAETNEDQNEAVNCNQLEQGQEQSKEVVSDPSTDAVVADSS